MNVLWFQTEGTAQAALNLINANFRVLATGAGYDLDENGNIIGKDSNGNDQPDAQVTERWDNPHYDTNADAWWILDPAVRFSQVEQLAVIMRNVTGYTEGEYTYPPDPEE